MKTFANSGTLSYNKQHFNYRLSHACIVVEDAFGHLKARWRWLFKSTFQRAYYILHNICEIHVMRQCMLCTCTCSEYFSLRYSKILNKFNVSHT